MLADQGLPEEEPLPRVEESRRDLMFVSQFCHDHFLFPPLTRAESLRSCRLTPLGVRGSACGWREHRIPTERRGSARYLSAIPRPARRVAYSPQEKHPAPPLPVGP